mmetsp:Transcript_5660/g.24022  ORF Transcript_5660/g.24022 Transcript_5660/m.24022 type:complete len:314 (-) Transcript_5660:349-1290(-)
MNCFGTSISKPSLRTSSLNSMRRGSTSSNPSSLGKPPTLWCDLMVCECFWSEPGGGQDSMTSGYSVPCTKNVGRTPVFFSTSALYSLNTSMNCAPMVLRFFSGSVTPFSLASRRAESSTHVTGKCRWSLNIFITRSCSLKRSRPLSTKQQCRRSPIARCTSVAATALSTPPESAQMTCASGPTFSFTIAICSSSTFCMDQPAVRPAMSNRKRLIVSNPRSLCVTSGWYCRPNSLRFGSSIATTAPASLLPTQLNPSGSFVASSPCDIHTCCESVGSPLNRSESFTVCTGMRPYSAFSAASTEPPRRCTRSCMP